MRCQVLIGQDGQLISFFRGEEDEEQRGGRALNRLFNFDHLVSPFKARQKHDWQASRWKSLLLFVIVECLSRNTLRCQLKLRCDAAWSSLWRHADPPFYMFVLWWIYQHVCWNISMTRKKKKDQRIWLRMSRLNVYLNMIGLIRHFQQNWLAAFGGFNQEM